MDKKQNIFIFGTTPFSEEVMHYFQERSEYNVVGFVVDDEYKKQDTFCGLSVVPMSDCQSKYPKETHGCFVSLGYKNMNRLRQEKMNYFMKQGYQLVSYIDPSVKRFQNSYIGVNCFIMENVVLQWDTSVADGCIILSGTCIGHHTTIGKYVFISIGAMIAGITKIGENSFIGANATIIDNLNVAPYTLVGAGSYISKNTSQYGVYVREKSKDIIKNMDCKEKLQTQYL